MQIFSNPKSRQILIRLLIIFFFIAVSFLFCLPLLKELHQSCSGDWDYFASLFEVPSISIYEYGEVPLWNPYCGGGIPLMGNPQAGFISITFVLTSIFGVFAGLKLAVWLHTFLGLWGMWLLSGELGIRGTPRFLPSLIFMFSAPWAFHLTEGHMVWLPAAFLPFLMIAFLKSMVKKHWVFVAAIVEAAMIYEGGTYVLAYSALFLVIFALCLSIELRTFRPIVSFIIINLLAAAFAAPKLLPVLDMLGNHPREMKSGNPLHWDELLGIFIERDILRGDNNHEYASYIGLPTVVFFLFGLVTLKKHKSLIISSLFMLFLLIGNFAPFSPWALLHNLPLFSNFQLPTRSNIIFSFTIALIVGLYLSRVIEIENKWTTIFATLAVLYIGTDLFLYGRSIFPQARTPAQVSIFRFDGPITLDKPAELFYISPEDSTGINRSIKSIHKPFSQISIPGIERFRHGAWSNQYLPLLHNRGVTDAYETIPYDRFAIPINDVKYRGEYYLQQDGIVEIKQWSPNKLSFRVNLKKDNRLILNQNYWPGWHASRGMIVNSGGLLAVNLKAGEYDTIIRYLPISFIAGLLISMAAVAAITIFLFLKTEAIHNETKPG